MSRAFVYILRCSDNALYIGSAADVPARLTRHNDGRGCPFTRVRLPVTLVWAEPHRTLKSATARELQLKGWTRAKKEALISGDQGALKRLSRCKPNPARHSSPESCPAPMDDLPPRDRRLPECPLP